MISMKDTNQYQSLLHNNVKFFPLSKKNIAAFQSHIYNYYKKNRRSFPWRDTTDPYQILVSEYMLQQTQTTRVIEKFNLFIKKFPDFSSLAQATTDEVLRYWSGLGYNRRALYLKKCAEIVHKKYNDTLPNTEKQLQSIPGIGPYTASALLTFIFNQPVILIETNVRAVYLHFFFINQNNVDDKDILPLIEKTLDRKNPREWYYALMDYGVMLKKQFTNPSRKSRHHYRQSPFEGSQRQIRGKIIKYLLTHPSASESTLSEYHDISIEKLQPILRQLVKEQILRQNGLNYAIEEK